MESIVIFDEYNEIDIKPSNLLKRYIQLTEKDVANILIKDQCLKEYPCPGCNGNDKIASFTKFGLSYVECKMCHTLYISPRPDIHNLRNYYAQSLSQRYWSNEFSRLTGKKRKDKIIKPRFQWIQDSTYEYLPDAVHIVDINTKQYGYIEEMANAKTFKLKTIVDPFLNLDNEYINNINIINTPFYEAALDQPADVILIFEVADRMGDIDLLFSKINNMLRENGLCFMTAILGSGFDVQTLWEHAENIFPPDRLNVFSVEGLQRLFQRHNFECLEFSTPGVLDVEIVEKAMRQRPEIKVPRFIEYMLRTREEESKKSFQQFLQENLLSSYGRILIRKIK